MYYVYINICSDISFFFLYFKWTASASIFKESRTIFGTDGFQVSNGLQVPARNGAQIDLYVGIVQSCMLLSLWASYLKFSRLSIRVYVYITIQIQ